MFACAAYTWAWICRTLIGWLMKQAVTEAHHMHTSLDRWSKSPKIVGASPLRLVEQVFEDCGTSYCVVLFISSYYIVSRAVLCNFGSAGLKIVGCACSKCTRFWWTVRRGTVHQKHAALGRPKWWANLQFSGKFPILYMEIECMENWICGEQNVWKYIGKPW